MVKNGDVLFKNKFGEIMYMFLKLVMIDFNVGVEIGEVVLFENVFFEVK